MSDPLLSVRDLEKSFPIRRSFGQRLRRLPVERLAAVDHVSFDVRRGETLGIVGESGSGKSTLARCLVRLYTPDSGRILLDGVDVTHVRGSEVRAMRRRIQMVFQDPYSSLNPYLTVRSALVEAARVHGRVNSASEERFVSDLLATVGLPETAAARRPRQLSGGQRQRVAIARALAVGPDLLVADEAVSGLDVSIQAQILTLFGDLRRQLDLAMIFISHQLSVVSHVADRVVVMYLGKILESGSTIDVFTRPQHPYTRALLDAEPIPDPTVKRAHAAAAGDVPSSLVRPAGCPFTSRCPYAEPICVQVDPPLESVESGRRVACHVMPYRDLARD